MADIVSKETRSRMMSGIRGKDTKPELRLRRALHALGFRFRLHAKELPGKPDILLPRYRAAIEVNGCFWHRHGCSHFRLPATRQEFWAAKLDRNVELDRVSRDALIRSGWRVLTVWECAMRPPTALDEKDLMDLVTQWIRSTEPTGDIAGLDP